MLALSYKSKQYLWALLKVATLAFVFWFIFKRLSKIDFYTFEHFKNRTLFDLQESKWFLISCLVLSVLNWLLEITKWQQLVKNISQISFKKATRESLAGSTLTFITPAKIGEYGIKAGYYKKSYRSKIIIANIIGNGVQLLVTILFGVIASCYFLYFLDFTEINRIIRVTFITGLLLLLLLYLFRKNNIFKTEISLAVTINQTKKMTRSRQINVIILSVLRYLSFSLCFYLLLWLFGGNISFTDAIAPIFAMYFFSSLLPSFFIIDVALKGGIAIYLLSFYDVAPIPVMCTALAMWLLNFAFPAIIGSYFVMTFKPQTSV